MKLIAAIEGNRITGTMSIVAAECVFNADRIEVTTDNGDCTITAIGAIAAIDAATEHDAECDCECDNT